jgi:hypothetical protein
VKFYALCIANEMIEALSCKLGMFGVGIDDPVNVNCDNEAVYKTL